MTSSSDPAPAPTRPAPPALRPVDLVLEGGGVKAIAIAGALEVLEERGYRARRVAGSSAGAMAGALVSAGIPAARIVEILRETDFRHFEDGPWWTRTLPGKALAVLLHQGVHPGDALSDWIERQLAAHGTPGRTGTFADLRWEDPDGEEMGGPPYRLTVTASDLTAGRLRLLPGDATDLGIAADGLRVVDAVRASASIPLVFRPVRWNEPGRPASWLVDGGLLSNFPVAVFDRPGGLAPRWPTFGVKLSGRPETVTGSRNRIRGPLSYARAVLDTVTGFYDRMHIESSDSVARTIFIDTDAVRPTDFGLSADQVELLYRKGREGAIEFLDGKAGQEPWDFEGYVAAHRGGGGGGRSG